MSMNGHFANAVLPQARTGGQVPPVRPVAVPAPGSGAPMPPPEPSTPASEVFTGLVVDARGLGALPAMAPKILDEDGKEVYGSAMVSRNYAVQQGMAGYTRDLDVALGSDRVTHNPLTVKGLRTVGPGKSDIVISTRDSSQISSAANNLDFMQKCRVMIVVD